MLTSKLGIQLKLWKKVRNPSSDFIAITGLAVLVAETTLFLAHTHKKNKHKK